MNILVTGGLGYIGSHLCVELLNSGFNVITADIMSDTDKIGKIINNIQIITKKKILQHFIIDISDKIKLDKVFQCYRINAVIHLAGHKSIPESILDPLKYFQNNLNSTMTLLEIMIKYQCKNIVFSSSASVYSRHNPLPITEDSLTESENPYSFTKLAIETLLQHLYQSDRLWRIIILRYFNPIGIHHSGLLPFDSEESNDLFNSLMSSIMKTLKHKQDHLNIYGNKYDTKDGTAMRDFIHIMDLVSSHCHVLDKILKNSESADGSEKDTEDKKDKDGSEKRGILKIYNVGMGEGITILNLISIVENITEKKLKYRFVEERPGDIPKIYTSIDKIKKELNWTPKYTLDDACQSLISTLTLISNTPTLNIQH